MWKIISHADQITGSALAPSSRLMTTDSVVKDKNKDQDLAGRNQREE